MTLAATLHDQSSAFKAHTYLLTLDSTRLESAYDLAEKRLIILSEYL